MRGQAGIQGQVGRRGSVLTLHQGWGLESPPPGPGGAQSVQVPRAYTLQRASHGVGQEGAGGPASLLAGILRPSLAGSRQPRVHLSSSWPWCPRQRASRSFLSCLLPGRAPWGAQLISPGLGSAWGWGQTGLSLLGSPCSCFFCGGTSPKAWLGVESELQLPAYPTATAMRVGSELHLRPAPQLTATLDP